MRVMSSRHLRRARGSRDAIERRSFASSGRSRGVERAPVARPFGRAAPRRRARVIRSSDTRPLDAQGGTLHERTHHALASSGASSSGRNRPSPVATTTPPCRLETVPASPCCTASREGLRSWPERGRARVGRIDLVRFTRSRRGSSLAGPIVGTGGDSLVNVSSASSATVVAFRSPAVRGLNRHARSGVAA